MAIKLRQLSIGVCLLVLAIPTTQAGDFQFSGFGSFIAGIRDHNKAAGGQDYAGYNKGDFSFDPDSLIGVQAVVPVNDKVSATVQLVTRGDTHWDTQVDWAYVRYQVTDEFSWRLGRIRVPFYLYSDFITVGYAYPWITPPYEVYNIPFSNVNGGDVVWLHSFANMDLQIQAYVGSESFNFDSTTPLAGNPGESRNQYGLIGELSWQALKFRYAYHAADVYGDASGTQIETLITAVNALGETRTADRFTLERDPFGFHDLAVRYDDGSLILVAEGIYLSAHNQAPTSIRKGYFVSGGYHVGSWLGMLTWGSRKDGVPDLAKDLSPTSPLYATIQGVQESLAQDTKQVTATARWDFTEGMAFKMEVIDFKDNNNSDNDTIVTRAGIQAVF